MNRLQAAFLFVVVMNGPYQAQAGKLSMENYSEVLIENLVPGRQYSMIETSNLPLRIVNGSDEAITVKVEVLKVISTETKKGFEPLPDLKWVQIVPGEIEIPANQTYESDVKIRIPNRPKYFGKKYQAYVMARILPRNKALIAIALGVKGRMLITTVKSKAAAGLENPKSRGNMNFEILPRTAVLVEAPLGQELAIMTKDKQPIELANRSRDDIHFIISSLDPRATIKSLEAGFEACPNPDFLKIAPDEMAVPAGQKKTVAMTLAIPNLPEYKDKRFMFLVAFQSGVNNSATRYLTLLVQTK